MTLVEVISNIDSRMQTNRDQLMGGADSTHEKQEFPSLNQMGITDEVIETIFEHAKLASTYGKKADYIPALLKPADKYAIGISSLQQNDSIIQGDGQDVSVSIQSVIKPFLLLYALSKGEELDEIGDIEATDRAFNDDPMHDLSRDGKLPRHVLNNAGGISSAGAIDKWTDFLQFMKKLTGNQNLRVKESVYQSEMDNNAGNTSLAMLLARGGERFGTEIVGKEKALKALDMYTRACSLGLTTKDLLNAGTVLANYGLSLNGEQYFDKNSAIKTFAAMNSFGSYEETGKNTLRNSGSRANSIKSGVGGYILNVDPGRGAFVTYNPYLNMAGNSVFGVNAMALLNRTLSSNNGHDQLDPEELTKIFDKYNALEAGRIDEEADKYVAKGDSTSHFRFDQQALKEGTERLEKVLDARRNRVKQAYDPKRN